MIVPNVVRDDMYRVMQGEMYGGEVSDKEKAQ